MNKQKPAQNIPLAGHLFIIDAALPWGTNGTAQTFSPTGFDPKVIAVLGLLTGSGYPAAGNPAKNPGKMVT